MRSSEKGLAIHGWIIIDKPAGMSSNAVVRRVLKTINAKKGGHAGTLDPLATGILPIALGEATKTVSFAMDCRKTYRFSVVWGVSTTTDDEEGDTIKTSDYRPCEREIKNKLKSFLGEINQIPPSYSALKINGTRAYKLARIHQPVTLKARIVTVHSLSLLRIVSSNESVFEVIVSKGTYIRSLARDLAYDLGTVGHVKNLRRMSVGPFSESQAISLDSLETLGHSAACSKYLLGIEEVLDDIPALAFTSEDARRLRCGQTVSILSATNRTSTSGLNQDDVVTAVADGKVMALARIKGDQIRPHRILNI